MVEPRKLLTYILGVLAILSIIGYTVFELRIFREGPIIEIRSPKNGELVNSPLIEITGSAKNVTFIYVNGRQTYITNQGQIFEKLLLQEGYNIITFEAKDRFGRETRSVLELYYQNKETN